MKNKRFTRLASTMMVCLMLLSVLAAVPVLAGEEAGMSLMDSPTTNSTSSKTDTPTGIEGIEVTGYELFNQDGAINKIGPKSAFWVRLIVEDKRLVEKGLIAELQKKPEDIRVNVNSTSFSLNGNSLPRISDFRGNAYVLDIPVYYNGTDTTFACDIYYANWSDLSLFHYSTQFNQLVPTVSSTSSTSDSTSSTVTRGTGFVLKSASYGDSDIAAGKNFTLDAILLSTNGNYSVENVSVSLVLPKEITQVSGNSVTYVGTVKPNQNVPVAFELLASAIAENGSYKITVNITGVNAKDGTEVKASMDIAVPVVQPERFEISNATLPETLTIGADDGSGYTSVTLVNKGKAIVYNVSAQVVGEGLSTQEGNQFIGNIAAGGQNSADFTVSATKSGTLQGQVIITYENARGEEKTLTKDFTVTAQENMIDSGMVIGNGIEPMPEQQAGIPAWVWLLAVVGVIAVAVVVLVIVMKKRKAKKAAQLEEELNQDDEDI